MVFPVPSRLEPKLRNTRTRAAWTYERPVPIKDRDPMRVPTPWNARTSWAKILLGRQFPVTPHIVH